MTATATLERPATLSLASAPTVPKRASRRRKSTPQALLECPPSTEDASLASRAKEAAVRLLERRGYDILERDWSCHAGYADIICRDPENKAVVFVEVKARRKGFPPDVISPEKREWLEGTALAYLVECDCCDVPVRFDTVSIIPLASDRAFVRHHIDALSNA